MTVVRELFRPVPGLPGGMVPELNWVPGIDLEDLIWCYFCSFRFGLNSTEYACRAEKGWKDERRKKSSG